MLRRGKAKIAVAILGASLVLAAAGAAPSSAAGKTADPGLPFGFQVQATNGFQAFVYATKGLQTGGDHVDAALYVRSSKDLVTYSTPDVQYSNGSLQAKFGSVASIDMDFVPAGRQRTQRSPCGSTPARYAAGTYVGSFEFQGEEGFAEASATSVQRDFAYLLDEFCEEGADESVLPSRRGAELRVSGGKELRWPPNGGRQHFSLRINKNSPGARARFVASVQEENGGYFAFRQSIRTLPSGSFVFPGKLGRARVSPPAPFSGAGSFVEAPQRKWKGNLSVDLPGRADVPFHGGGFRGELIPGKLDPSTLP